MSVVVETRRTIGFSVIFLELLPAALVVALLAGVGVMHVTSRVLVVSMGYELSRLDSKVAVLKRDNDALNVELATLKSPARLEALAKERLGLMSPPASSVVHLSSGTVPASSTPLTTSRRPR